MSRKTRMRSHPTASIGMELSSSRLPRVQARQKVTSEVNNIRSFAPSGRSGPGMLNTKNYPFFNYFRSRARKAR